MSVNREILFPIFLECCQYIDCDYWKNIFENLAYGTVPYGSYISKNFLCCSYKGKEFTYKIDETDPLKVYKNVYNLLNKKLGLMSKSEMIKKTTKYQDIEDTMNLSKQTWKGIRKKNIRDLLIEKFVLENKNKYNLDMKKAKYLKSFIEIALILKIITSEDIEYDGKTILSISGIKFIEGDIVIKKDIYKLTTTSTEETNTLNTMASRWDKYCEANF